jgi:nucleotide-binding universal stress UspA family protein
LAPAREEAQTVIKNIMVPLDGSETAERALAHAAALAHAFDARIILARVPETMVVPVMSGAVWVTEEVETKEATGQAGSYLAELMERPELKSLTVDAATPAHPVTEGLLKAIEEHSVDLVVMTTHGYSGFKRFVFGSVGDKLLRVAPAPVYLIRESEEHAPKPRFRRVLVPLDGSELAEQALESAELLCHATGAALTLVQVPTIPSYVTSIPETSGWIPKYLGEQTADATTYLQGIASRLADEGMPVEIDVEVVTAGRVSDGILSSAHEHEADVIVMCTHGRTGLGRWVFGSVADQVLREADRPVWLARASDDTED